MHSTCASKIQRGSDRNPKVVVNANSINNNKYEGSKWKEKGWYEQWENKEEKKVEFSEEVDYWNAGWIDKGNDDDVIDDDEEKCERVASSSVGIKGIEEKIGENNHEIKNSCFKTRDKSFRYSRV